jgi:hypothetical protein
LDSGTEKPFPGSHPRFEGASVEVGAPGNEIEGTPEMIEAGYDVYCQMVTDVEVSVIPAREIIIKIFLAVQGTVR